MLLTLADVPRIKDMREASPNTMSFTLSSTHLFPPLERLIILSMLFYSAISASNLASVVPSTECIMQTNLVLQAELNSLFDLLEGGLLEAAKTKLFNNILEFEFSELSLIPLVLAVALRSPIVPFPRNSLLQEWLLFVLWRRIFPCPVVRAVVARFNGNEILLAHRAYTA